MFEAATAPARTFQTENGNAKQRGHEHTTHETVTETGNPPLPKGCRPLTHQVAGHRYGHGRLKIGMLQHTDGTILKPVQPPPRGQCELDFYTKVFDKKQSDPVLLTLRPFLPQFYGEHCPPPHDDVPAFCNYMKLEDACKRFKNPSILDIKIGQVSYDPDADAEKIAIESEKYPPLKTIGFQLLGMRISGPSPNEAIFYDKKFGRSLTPDNISEGFELFLSGNKAWRKYLLKAFLQRLETILSWFESQKELQFYSSSLLLIFEGEFLDSSSDSDEEFIHKYRCMNPKMMPDYFHTINSVLEANNPVAKIKSPYYPVQHEHKVQHHLHHHHQHGHHHHATTMSLKPVEKKSNGSESSESGYASEVDTKNKKKATETAIQQEFVAQLSSRLQKSMISNDKYRFPPDLVDVRMIDFTHVFNEPRPDTNYLYGLRNLIAHFKQLLKHS